MQTASSLPLFLTPDIDLRKSNNGVIYLSSNHRLGDLPPSVLSYLERWAHERPSTIFLAERGRSDPSVWDSISYGETFTRARRLALALKATGLSADRPLMILSGNSISFALMTLACMMIGVPVVPISPSYSLLSQDFSKVKHIQELVNPGLVFAESWQPFGAVLEMLQERGVAAVTADPGAQTGLNLAELIGGQKEPANHDLGEAANPEAVAKILFTSGSTGMPKGVINTHRMLVSNQEAIARMWPFIEEPGHIFLDWLPWHHTFGGNHNFNMVLRNGGTLYIDGGKPTPDAVKLTLDNLREISPTLYFNVAAGYELLVGYLEQDDALASNFFKNLRLIFFAAAALPTPTWNRLEALIDKHASREIPITSSWGATETSPLCTSVYFANRVPRNIGVPVPGTEVKLAPVGDMTELRVRGPNIMPSYWRNAEKSREVFDEEGYFCSGDAVELIDPDNPAAGLMFKGRVSENFKLQTGTWVNVGELRVTLVEALAPLATDLVICGENESYLSILIFPNVAECQAYLGSATQGEMLSNPRLQQEIARRLDAHNTANPGSSKQVLRALLLDLPPSFDKNEITDKGYLNQRGVRSNRIKEVAALYAETAKETIILVSQN